MYSRSHNIFVVPRYRFPDLASAVVSSVVVPMLPLRFDLVLSAGAALLKARQNLKNFLLSFCLIAFNCG